MLFSLFPPPSCSEPCSTRHRNRKGDSCARRRHIYCPGEGRSTEDRGEHGAPLREGEDFKRGIPSTDCPCVMPPYISCPTLDQDSSPPGTWDTYKGRRRHRKRRRSLKFEWTPTEPPAVCPHFSSSVLPSPRPQILVPDVGLFRTGQALVGHEHCHTDSFAAS